eukprot:7831129-Ditylum_brightwellii.AAC.1
MKAGEKQGKTSSPSNWLFQSSTLLKSLEDQRSGLYLTSVDEKYVSAHVAEGYVDDCNAGTADQQTQQSDTPDFITQQMQNIAQTWADLIYGSGGEVSLPKSCWWLVWWNWKDDKAKLATVSEVDAQINLVNQQTEETAILERKDPSNAIRQLGVQNNLLVGQTADFSKRYSLSMKMG